MVQEIRNSTIPKRLQSKPLGFIACILDFQTVRHLPLAAPCSIHSDFLRALDPNYHRWLPLLEQMGIVQVEHSWINDPENPHLNRTKRYSINEEYLRGEMESITVEIKRKKGKLPPGFIEAEAKACMEQAPIRKDEALAYIREYVTERRFLNGVRFDAEITDEIVTVDLMQKDGRYKSYTYKLENALYKAWKKGLYLIQEGNRCIMEDKAEYIARKERDILISWTRQVLNWESHRFFASRNDSNWRLDTNFTVLPSELEQFIGSEGDENTKIDLCNSQHVINSNIFLQRLNDGSYMSVNFDDDSVKLYREASMSGELYEKVAEKCGMASRNEAKIPFLKLTFMKPSAQSPEKRILSQELGEVVSFFDQMKSRFGNSGFANLLTSTESMLMLDGAYAEMRKLGIWGLTKHDSVTVHKRDVPQALEIISKHLLEYLDGFALKVGDEKVVFTNKIETK